MLFCRNSIPATRDCVVWATSALSDWGMMILSWGSPIVGIADGAVVDRYQASIELGPHPRLGCSRTSEILGCGVMEPGRWPSVYRVGLSQLPRAGTMRPHREPAHEI